MVGFVDWDMAGPRKVHDDVAWVAFSWVPMHARAVVEAEGFRDFDHRAERLSTFLHAYGSTASPEDVMGSLDTILDAQIAMMHIKAAAGDQAYRRMLEVGRDNDLAEARVELRELGAWR